MFNRLKTARFAIADMPDGAYVELVRSLFATIVPALIMAVSFVGVGALIVHERPDLILGTLTIVGGVASAARIAIVLLTHPWVDDELAIGDVRRLERSFAATYLSFAMVFGVFAARALVMAPEHLRILIVGLVFGYGAGVAAGVALRPWISVSAMVLAIVPTLVAAAITPDFTLRAFALMLLLFTAGGIQSMLTRYHDVVRRIEMRQIFATLARHDDLTGLSNRLSMRESFLVAARTSAGSGIAVHCLDLDRFKPVNDRYGHPVGDLLLKAVAGRLEGLLRHGDFAARIGGDEFVIVQAGIGHEGEAEMLARRIVRAIAQPYEIDGHVIEIGTSVGYALSRDCGDNLDRLIACADAALYEAKRSNGIAAHNAARPGEPIQQAV